MASCVTSDQRSEAENKRGGRVKRNLVRGLPGITVFADHLSPSRGPFSILCRAAANYQFIRINWTLDYLDVDSKKVFKSSQFLASLLYNYGLMLKLD